MKPKRDKMFAFLLGLDMCAKGASKYRGLTPEQAWDKATKNGDADSLPMRFHYNGYDRCWCARLSKNPKLPAKLAAAYRAFKVVR